MSEVIIVLIMVPFQMVGHISGLLFEAFSRGFREGRKTADALLTEVQQVSDRKRAEKSKRP